jgi:hypothetical protein
MKNPEPDGILSVAARSVGHAAGKAAIALGLENAGAAKPIKQPKKHAAKAKRVKRVSARSNRIAKAAAAKKVAVALGKEFGSGDLRYRRIVGKTAAAWSQADVDYVEQITSDKKQRAPA